MKTRNLFLLPALVLAMVSCTDSLSNQSLWDSGVMATLPSYSDKSATKVEFTNGLANFLWSNGDCIGICRSSSSANGTAAFTLLKGGSTVGNFINDAFSLLPNTEYCAFYPFAASATSSSFPVNIVTQIQNGNNNVSHIGPFNYMSAKFTTDANGKASFTFSNIGAVIQVHFTADSEDTYQSLSITSDGAPFTIRATYNLSSETLTQPFTHETFRVSFGEGGMHVYNGEAVTVSAVILPCDLSQSTLTFTVNNASGVAKEFSLAGFAFTKGKLYHFYENDSKGNPPYGGCPDGHHPHAIDLGLPSGTLWSCMELGAETPLEPGFTYSWGQTAYAQKNGSGWDNYEFMDESYNNEYGITKYQIADNSSDGVWYNADGVFIGDNKTTLEMQDDAVRQNWGGAWRMPTKEEAEELLTYAFLGTSYDYYGVRNGGPVLYKKKASGNYTLWDTHIFIPSSSLRGFWTSSLYSDTRSAYHFNWSSRDGSTSRWRIQSAARTNQYYIRPVQSKPSAE